MVKIGIGQYRKEDYNEILSLSEDRENMDATWEDWKKSKAKAVKNFKIGGVYPIDIVVIPSELVNYCREQGLKINGKSRSKFIASKASLIESE